MEHPGYPLPGPGGERPTKGGHVSTENGFQSLALLLLDLKYALRTYKMAPLGVFPLNLIEEVSSLLFSDERYSPGSSNRLMRVSCARSPAPSSGQFYYSLHRLSRRAGTTEYW